MKVERFYSGGKPKLEPAILFFNHNAYELVCRNEKTGVVDTYVSLFEVKEIRRGKKCTDIEMWLATASAKEKEIDGGQCFSVLYGTTFRLKTLSVTLPTSRDAENWLDGLHYLVENRPTCYLDRLDFWLAKQFDNVSVKPTVKRRKSLAVTDLKEFVSTISGNTDNGKLLDLLRKGGRTVNLPFSEFNEMMQKALYDKQIFSQCIGKYTDIGDDNGSEFNHRLSRSTFHEFLAREQDEVKDVSECYQHCDKYKSDMSPNGYHFISCYNFVNYLFSKDNQVWNANKCDVVYQDMTQPLSHYWIASSHNTYLMGDQISSESSVEAYAQCLRQGCRCIELDCWDGPSGIPEIYHGRTLTTKVGLVPVLKTIRDHAFVKSEYPVILSIENHCTLSQQRVMYQTFQEIFGDILVTKPLFKVESELPSPYALRRRILLKGRTLPKQNRAWTQFANGDTNETGKKTKSLNDSFKTGKMYLYGCGQWEPYFFVLTSEKLIYTEIVSSKEGGKEDVDDTESYNGVPIQELHNDEIWFHGKVAGGTAEAEEKLQRFGVEGGFLVRESEKEPESLILSFFSLDKTYHLKVATTPDKAYYYFTAKEKFDSVYSLVTHYQEQRLETSSFSIRNFTQPVPQQSFSWFYPNTLHPEPMNRKRAEEILKKIPLCGAFLVRYASEYLKNRKSEDRYVITFRMANRLRHCRVKEEVSSKQRLFFVVASQPRFQGIKQLIDYYSQEQSFYQGHKLKYSINEDLYNMAHLVHNPDAYRVYTSSIDYEIDVCVRVRALYSYNPSKENMLNFKRGDVIINVIKHDELWWKGDLGKQNQRYFPANLVEEMESVDSPFGKLEKGCMGLGKVEIEENVGDSNFPFVLKVHASGNQTPHRIAVKSENEAKEWQAMITWVRNRRETTPKEWTSWLGLNQKKDMIDPEFSKLMVYCSTVSKVCPKKVKEDGRVYKEMVSFNEVTANKKIELDPGFYLWLNQVQLSRVYPKAQRIDSSNYSPIRFWNHGCQLVALNYQTPDQPMQLLRGKFRDNGNCGYVLKPAFMLRKNCFNPSNVADMILNGIPPANFQITIIAGRHLFRADNKRIQKPVVTIEILGADSDCQKVYTVTKNANNGLNPYWNETFHLKVLNPDLALVHFIVQDRDNFGDPYMVAQAAYPVKHLKFGYRSVVLENGYGEELLSRLLIHVQWLRGVLHNQKPDWVLLNE